MRHPRRRTASVAVAAGLLTLASPAVAAAPSYKGKVKGGGAITFQVSGGAVRHLTASVDVLCTSAVGARSHIDIYHVTPAKAARVKRDGAFTSTVKLKKQPLFANGKRVDTLYTVTASITGRIHGGNASGSAHVTYNKNWFVPDPTTGYLQLTIAACRATTTWSAKRR
jgi:hypothetical protein